jgi:hypothetical protein
LLDPRAADPGWGECRVGVYQFDQPLKASFSFLLCDFHDSHQ